MIPAALLPKGLPGFVLLIMKKLLALVLALVMTLGLATVSSSAAYDDAADINYDEAVDVMTAVGVFQGKGSNFDPKANLNRAEAAKIVAYLMLGNSAAENLKGTGTKFTDVPASHWAAGYIEYLASVGIVSGVGNNQFDPNGQVTAIQLAKMLLVALGYDAEIEGFVGSDWAINIQSRANKVGIYDGNDNVTGSAAVTRDEAALYAFNTIKAPLVEYEDKGTTIKIGEASVVTGASNWKYKTSTIMKNQTISDDVLNNGVLTSPYIVEFAEEYYKDLKLEGLGTTSNDFGEPIHKWTNKNIEVGTYVVEKDLLETYSVKVTAKTLYDLLGKTRYDSITANSTWISFWEDGVNYAKIGGTNGVGNGSSANLDPYMSRNDTYKISNSDKGSTTEVFVDSDNNITVVTYHTYVYQASNNYNASTQNLNLKDAGDTDVAGRTLKSYVVSSKDYPVLEDVKADDYLLVSVYKDGTNYSVGKLEKATILTGKVESYKANSSVTIDGESRDYSNKTKSSTDTVPGNTNVKSTQYSVGQDTTVVLDKYGYIIAVDEAIVNANYVFVAKFGSTSGVTANLVASAYFTDGTSGEISIDKVYGTNGNELGKTTVMGTAASHHPLSAASEMTTLATSTWDVDYAGWYTFSKNSDGKYTLYAPRATGDLRQAAARGVNTTSDKVLFATAGTDISDPYNAATSSYTQNDPNILKLASTQSMAAIRANDKTIVVVHDLTGTNDDVFVYTGVKNIPDVTLNGGQSVVVAAYKTNSLYAEYVFISVDGNNATVEDGSNEALLYIANDEGTYYRDNTERYYKWRVLNEAHNGFTTANATNPSGADYQAVYRVRTNAKDEYTGNTSLRTDAMIATPLVNAGANTVGGTARVAITGSGKYISMNGIDNGNDNRYYGSGATATGALAAAAGKIVYSDKTLWLNGVGFSLADDAQITLVLLPGASALMNDKKADREAIPVTASDLASRLNNYPFAVYDVQARLDDTFAAPTSNRTIHEAYVTVRSATTSLASTDAATIATTLRDGAANITASSLVVDADITVGTDDTLDVTGNVTVKSGYKLTINNNVTIGGKLTVENGASVEIAGTSGDETVVYVGGNANSDIYGDVTVKAYATLDIGSNNTPPATGARTRVYDGGDLTVTGTNAHFYGNRVDVAGNSLHLLGAARADVTELHVTGSFTTAGTSTVASTGAVTFEAGSEVALAAGTTLTAGGNVTIKSGSEVSIASALDAGTNNITIEDDSEVAIAGTAAITAKALSNANDELVVAATANLSSVDTITATTEDAANALKNSTTAATKGVEVKDPSKTTVTVYVNAANGATGVKAAKNGSTAATVTFNTAFQIEAEMNKALVLEVSDWGSMASYDFAKVAYLTDEDKTAYGDSLAIDGNLITIPASKVTEDLYVMIGIPTVTLNITPGATTDTYGWAANADAKIAAKSAAAINGSQAAATDVVVPKDAIVTLTVQGASNVYTVSKATFNAAKSVPQDSSNIKESGKDAGSTAKAGNVTFVFKATAADNIELTAAATYTDVITVTFDENVDTTKTGAAQLTKQSGGTIGVEKVSATEYKVYCASSDVIKAKVTAKNAGQTITKYNTTTSETVTFGKENNATGGEPSEATAGVYTLYLKIKETGTAGAITLKGATAPATPA